MSKYPDSIDRITRARIAFSAAWSVFSIAITIFFIGILVYVAFFSTKYIQDLSKKIEVEVLFYSEVREADVMAYEQQLKMKHYVAASRFSSKSENTEIAKKILGNDFTEVIPNPINATIIFSVTPEYANSDSLAVIERDIMKNSEVKDIEYPDSIVKSVLNNFMKVQIIIFIICAIFMIISMILIANYIRLQIYAKRFGIRSMMLVGATKGFVRRPFVFKGFVQGVLGGILAIIMLAGLLYLGNIHIPVMVNFDYILEISILLAGIFLLSILFTILVSLYSVNKYIKINTDRLYL
jgi:cell division transport system permease protein